MPDEKDEQTEPEEAPKGKPMPEETVSKAEYDRLRKELEDAYEVITQQDDELTASKARVAELEPFEAKAGEMTAKARSLEAARLYDRIAKELKVKDEFKDDVFKLSEFKPKDDGEIDEKAIREHFTKFLKERPHYTQGHGEPTKFAKGEGSSRGGKDDGFGEGAVKQKVTRAQLNDGDWMKANEDLILGGPDKYEIVQS